MKTEIDINVDHIRDNLRRVGEHMLKLAERISKTGTRPFTQDERDIVRLSFQQDIRRNADDMVASFLADNTDGIINACELTTQLSDKISKL